MTPDDPTDSGGKSEEVLVGRFAKRARGGDPRLSGAKERSEGLRQSECAAVEDLLRRTGNDLVSTGYTKPDEAEVLLDPSVCAA